jgi:hypothetical protein
MEKIEFNTGRKYAANGQPIVAVRFGETVIFKDEARLIVGTFELPAEQPLTQSAVMRAYDNYGYYMAAWKKEYEASPEPVAEPEPVTLFGLFYIDNDGKPALCDLIDGIYESCAFVDQRIAEDSAKYHNGKYGGNYFSGPLPKGVKARWIDDSVFEPIEPEPVKTVGQPAKFFEHNPTLLATFGGYCLYEHPTRGDSAPIYMSTPSGTLINTGFYDLGDFAYHNLGDNNEEGLALCREIEGGF